MAKPDPVQLADPRGDQPRPARLALIAIAACGSGLLVAFGISRAMSGLEVPVGAARGALASHTHEAAPHLSTASTASTAPHARTAPAPVEHSIAPARSAPPRAATLASAGVQPAPTGAAPLTPQVAEPKAQLAPP